MNPQMPTLLRVLVFNQREHLVAQCLEYDITAQGRSMDELRKRFYLTFWAHVQQSKELGRKPLEGVGRAPEEFFLRWQQAIANIIKSRLPLTKPEDGHEDELPTAAEFALQ